MAKTITAMAVGLALREGRIQSLDDRADRYAPTLAGTLYGETTVCHLLRMSSGAKFEERYDGKDDLARYGMAAYRGGAAEGARVITERLHAQGERFNYASAETDMLALVVTRFGLSPVSSAALLCLGCTARLSMWTRRKSW